MKHKTFAVLLLAIMLIANSGPVLAKNALTVRDQQKMQPFSRIEATDWALAQQHQSVPASFSFLPESSSLLQWNTFLSGSISARSGRILYKEGYTFVVGERDRQSFLAKYDSNGVAVWKSFFGSTPGNGSDLAIDGSGNIYVVGSSGDWGDPILPHQGLSDMYIAKFNSTGTLLWHTFIGFENDDWGNAIAINQNGDIFALGDGFGYPTPNTQENIWLAKLDTNGILKWVILGGSINSEYYTDLALDQQGNIYTVGYSGGSTFGTPINPPDGGYDAMVVKFDPDGYYQWHTFMGSSSYDKGTSIATDNYGSVFIAGESDKPWGTPIRPHSVDFGDAFLAKLDRNGYRRWHTFLGGTLLDHAKDIIIDPYGNLFVTGASPNDWETPINPHTEGTGFDAYVAKIGPNGILQWNTFIGGIARDDSYGIALGNDQDIYISGHSEGTWGTPVTNFGLGSAAVFVARISAPEIFEDVALNHWAHNYIQSLYISGVTGGCAINPPMFCPVTSVTRDQMAVFLLKGKHGSGYVPPAATGDFSDVPVNYWAGSWIEQLAAEGITSGCAIGSYCPAVPVGRDQMAVFLLKAKYGADHTPPPATGMFLDVPTDFWAAPWIEQLANEGITGGCGNGNYCPTSLVSRAEMAVFLVKTFNLP